MESSGTSLTIDSIREMLARLPQPQESASTLNGMKIIESVWLTQPGEPYAVRRGWYVRLLSRPWTPLRSTRTIVPQIPFRGFIRVSTNTAIAHPAFVQEIRQLTAVSQLYAGGAWGHDADTH